MLEFSVRFVPFKKSYNKPKMVHDSISVLVIVAAVLRSSCQIRWDRCATAVLRLVIKCGDNKLTHKNIVYVVSYFGHSHVRKTNKIHIIKRDCLVLAVLNEIFLEFTIPGHYIRTREWNSLVGLDIYPLIHLHLWHSSKFSSFTMLYKIHVNLQWHRGRSSSNILRILVNNNIVCSLLQCLVDLK